MPYATRARPAVTSSAPGTSSRRPSPRRLSVSQSSAPASTSAPTGTLISSTQRQVRYSVSTPPTRPPTAPPPAPTAVQVAMARVRAGPAGNAVVRMVRVAGESTAAPMPWTARAAISCHGSCARPPARLATVKRVSPTTNIRLRPKRSATRPPSSMKPAKVIT